MTEIEWEVLFETLTEIGITAEYVEEHLKTHPHFKLSDLVEDNRKEWDRLLEKNWRKRHFGKD